MKRLIVLTLAGLQLTPALAQISYRIPLRNESERKIANPAPAPRDFEKSNAGHKLIVAILGNGIDYNHPLLLENIHFDRLADGTLGAGIDFVGDDRLASHRLVKTSGYEFKDLSAGKKGEILEDSTEELYNEGLTRALAQSQCVYGALEAIDPRVAAYAPHIRPTWNEVSLYGLPYSTGIAGVIAGGKPEIGVIPYRTSPYNLSDTESKRQGLLQGWSELDQLKTAVDHASRSGVRMVYLPESHFIQRPDDTKSLSLRSELKSFVTKRDGLAGGYLEVMRAHPEMVFIAMTDANHGWTDDVSLIQFPCGLPARNLLCVSPLNDRQGIQTKFKIPVNEDARLVMTTPSREKIVTPADACLKIAAIVSEMTGNGVLQDVLGDDSVSMGSVCQYDENAGVWNRVQPSATQRSLIQEALDHCEGDKNWLADEKFFTDSQRAASQVARSVAELWVERPGITEGAKLLDLFFEKRVSCQRMGALNFCRTEAPGPDWESIKK